MNAAIKEEKYIDVLNMYFDIPFINVADYDSIHIKNPINNDGVVFFNTHDFIYKNLHSYKFKLDEAWTQFKLDFSRQKIMVDGKKCKEINDLISFLLKFDVFKYKIIKDVEVEIWLILMMLCNQSSYYLPFMYMKSMYDDNKNQINVLDSKSERIIAFTTKDKLEITFKTTFNVINIFNEKLEKSIDIEMNIRTGLILKNDKAEQVNANIFEKCSMLSWTIK